MCQLMAIGRQSDMLLVISSSRGDATAEQEPTNVATINPVLNPCRRLLRHSCVFCRPNISLLLLPSLGLLVVPCNKLTGRVTLGNSEERYPDHQIRNPGLRFNARKQTRKSDFICSDVSCCLL